MRSRLGILGCVHRGLTRERACRSCQPLIIGAILIVLLLVGGCTRTVIVTNDPQGAAVSTTPGPGGIATSTSVAEEDCVQSLTEGMRSRFIEGCDEATATTAGFPTRTLPPLTPLPTLGSSGTTLGTRFGPPPPYAQTIPGNGAGWAANGSGCVPGVSDYLPDGAWFGFVVGFTTDPSGSVAVQLDMGCFYEGSAAVAEAAHDNAHASGGVYVRNMSRLIFTAPVAPEALVAYLDYGGVHQAAAFGDWPYVLGNELIPCLGPQCSVWLYVEDGWVSIIQEQATR